MWIFGDSTYFSENPCKAVPYKFRIFRNFGRVHGGEFSWVAYVEVPQNRNVRITVALFSNEPYLLFDYHEPSAANTNKKTF